MNTNSQSQSQSVIAAIDVGSTKIVALVARRTLAGDFEYQGMSATAATGIKDGVVVDLDKASQAIQHVIQETQIRSGCSVTEAIVTVSGCHVRSRELSGIVVASGNGITQEDMDRAIESANAYSTSDDDQILHTIIQGYAINGKGNIKQPMGLAANRLEALVLRITADKLSIENLGASVQRSGVKVSGLIPQALAASYAVLSDEDKQEGICLIDIGSATTDLAVFREGNLTLLKTIPVGRDAITSHIAELIRPKAKELFYQIRDTLIKEDLWATIRKGIVLTGGMANLAGFAELLSHSLHCQVDIRLPRFPSFCDENMQSPEYAAVVGALGWWCYSQV